MKVDGEGVRKGDGDKPVSFSLSRDSEDDDNNDDNDNNKGDEDRRKWI